MRLERVCNFLETVPRYRISGDGTQAQIQCPYCGDSHKSDHGHFSVKLEIEPKEPMMFRCFRADCMKTGILTTDVLQLLGCQDTGTLLELAEYNRTISKKLDKPFLAKKNRQFQLVNLDISDNKEKLRYINARLGTNFETGDLRRFKIQLGLYEFLRVNYISKLAFGKQFCDMLDQYTIGFLSMYSDYLICRDITKKVVTGNRYTIYRTTGKPDPTDMKLYCIPTEIDIMTPEPAEINIAEGTFSILGAYLHTKLGRSMKNNIWLANCGSEYQATITHIAKQYGLLDMIIHIWSDSEIKLKKYEDLLRQISDQVNVVGFQVHYNTKAEDFGHPKSQIAIQTVTLK